MRSYNVDSCKKEKEKHRFEEANATLKWKKKNIKNQKKLNILNN